LVSGEVPATTEGYVELHESASVLVAVLGAGDLSWEEVLLSVENFEVVRETRLEAFEGHVDGLLVGSDGDVLLDANFAQFLASDERAGDFREGVEDGFFIVALSSQEFLASNLFGSAEATALEDRSGEASVDAPTRAFGGDVAEVRRDEAADSGEGDAGEVVSDGNADVSVCGAEFLFLLADVRTTVQDLSWDASRYSDSVGDFVQATGALDGSRSATSESAEGVFQASDLRLKQWDLSLSGGESSFSGSDLEFRADFTLQLGLEEIVAIGVRADGVFSDG
jgi:hypothetical protein